MRKIVLLPLICILLTVLFSCKKSNNQFVIGGTVTATVNGTIFVSESVTEEAIPSGVSSSVQFIDLFTATDSSKTHNIVLYLDSLSAGTYKYVTGLSNALQYNTGPNSYNTLPGSRGSIIITPIGTSSNTITGTFSGVAYIGSIDSVVITNGVFTNCAY